MRSVLSERLREGGVIIIEDFALDTHKTRDFIGKLAGLGLNKRTLIVDGSSNDNLALSSRNLREVTLVSPGSINIYDILTHEQLAITREAVLQLDKQLSGN